MIYGDYPSLTQVKKILIIKLRQLGDVLLTGPVFSALKKKFPAAEIDAYVYSEAIPLLEKHPAVHACIGYDRQWKKRGLFARLTQEGRLLRQIRARRYDLVINLTEGDRGAIAAKCSGAPVRVGFDPGRKGLFGKKGLYTHVVKSCTTLRHTVERNLDAVRRIGLFPDWEDRELYFHVPKELLGSNPDPYILIHPTSRWRFKCWPVANMRALAEALIAKGKSLVFTSGPDPDERAMVREICQGLPVRDLSGQISLQQLGALIAQSELLICVDSLPFHLASALKKRVVALFGPTSDITWGPWRNPNATILTQPFSCRPCYQDGCGGSKVSDCLVTLPVETVMRAVLQPKLFAEVAPASFGVRE
ncbi:MAG: putative lipopolysaccharide heptosyltransferase III [Verrucomicrobiota bacterium]|nr:putative lipopolysaccharide heptosyltransferase III [Verrucomicrobiota bacterium]